MFAKDLREGALPAVRPPAVGNHGVALEREPGLRLGLGQALGNSYYASYILIIYFSVDEIFIMR